MKILVTGAKGFIGKNLITELKNQQYTDIFEYDLDAELGLLDTYTKECDFVFHLAGVNRPDNQDEFMQGNFGFTSTLLESLKRHNNHATLMISSSIQAELNNPYGLSKKAGEDLLFNYSCETNAKVLVYRFPNVFGKWCRPNYNSAVATFCYNIAHNIPIIINNSNVVMNLVYIDDVVNELIYALHGKEHKDGAFCVAPVVYTKKLGEIAEMIKSFKEGRTTLSLPDMSNPFEKKLYSTYLSYLPTDQFSYPLKMNMDNRGSFTEFIKTLDRGQVSVNISKPGIIKGNHWHHSKCEKFLVVAGKGIIRFRKNDTENILEYFVSGAKLEVVDIPPGYTHNIENLGDTDMVTIMWANEPFNPDKPDTIFLEV
ncbi:MAG TPA: NAD-dependent epimerase/dehydratase family protein [Desulfitobacteriaceae bacterium]|nr:NAD-dependent epimerase/dehydratase family protein [Desulfitobacteriaceae bacterium]